VSGFDGIKALREEISGLVDVRLVMLKRERNLAAQYGELEVELNNVIKLRGFADAELARKRAVLATLEAQA
jgi:inorganic pyrophosphatase